MKTVKIFLPIAALLVGSLAFGQKSSPAKKPVISSENRTQARAKGTMNANEHANEHAQQNANENSVLNGNTVSTKKSKAKSGHNAIDKRNNYKLRKKS